MFKGGQTSIHDEKRLVRTSVLTDEPKSRIEEKIVRDRFDAVRRLEDF